MHYALKYSFWALKNKGILNIIDNGPYDVSIKPYRINFYQINQVIFQFLKDSVKLIRRDFKNGTICLQKIKSENTPKGWSCGVIYSGNQNEQLALTKCLDGIFSQEIFLKTNSEVIVCCPKKSDTSFFKEYPKNQNLFIEPTC